MDDIQGYFGRNGEVTEKNENQIMRVYDREEYERLRRFGIKHFEMEKQDRQSYLDAVGDGGNYVWNYFVPEQNSYENVINATVTRLVYLATFINGDGYIAFDNGKIMSRNQIRDKLKLDESTFKRFLRDAKEAEYLDEDDTGFRITSSKFSRGKLAKEGNQRAAKLFIYSVRFLYEHATVTSHKTLAYLYLIMPYVNLTYNVVCENPLETDRTKVRKMTVVELCNKLGLDITHSTRFINQLLKIQYPDRYGDKRSILVSVKDSKNDELREFLCVNPNLYSVFADKEKIYQITGLSDIFMIEEGEL